MMPGGIPCVRGVAHRGDVGRGLHEGLADRVDAVFEGKGHARAVVRSVKAEMPRSMPGMFSPFRGAQLAADDNMTPHVVALHAVDLQLYEPVVQEQPVAWLHDAAAGGRKTRTRARACPAPGGPSA